MMPMSLEEFSSKIRWQRKRKFKATNSYNARDYVKHFNQVKPKDKGYVINKDQYGKILSAVCERMVDEYLKYGYLVFPHQMGEIVMIKRDHTPKIVDGKVVVKKFVDWGETIKLWYEDEEAHKNKTLVRFSDRESYNTKYKKKRAKYKNKNFANFNVVRDVQKRISQLAKKGELNAFKGNTYETIHEPKGNTR